MNRLLASLVLAAASFACSQEAKAGELPDPKTLYKAELVAPTGLAAGKTAPAILKVTPIPSAHVKAETPFKAKLTTTGPVTVAKAELAYKDSARVENEGPVFEIPLAASAAGAGELKAQVDFYVCVAEACMKTSESLTAAVTVQ